MRAQRHESHTTTTYAQFLLDTSMDSGWSTEETERFTAGVIATLEERLVAKDARELEAQLPFQLRRRLRAEHIGQRDPKMTIEEFFGRVSSRIGEAIEDVEPIVRMVFRALRTHVDPNHAHQVETQLSDELKRLWNPPSFGRR